MHQCVSEDAWFRSMLNIDVDSPPLPRHETRTEFMKRYAEDSAKRLAALRDRSESWWEEPTRFFDVERTRAWVMMRRLTHTSHHRGQQMAMLRMLDRPLHSNYGPTADTGGLMHNHAPTIYAYGSVEALLEERIAVGARRPCQNRTVGRSPRDLNRLAWIRHRCPPDLRKGRQHVRARPHTARNLTYGYAPGEKRIGDQRSVTAPGHGLRAHQDDLLARRPLDTPVQAVAERRRLHVVGIPPEAPISPARVPGVTSGVAQSSEAWQVAIVNPRRGEAPPTARRD